MTIYKINEKGLAEIAAFLRANHKSGRVLSADREMLVAWAEMAEFQLGEGNPPSIEIKSWDSKHGYTQDYTVSEAGLDAEQIDI